MNFPSSSAGSQPPPSLKDLVFNVPPGWQQRPSVDGARVMDRAPDGSDDSAAFYNFFVLAPMAPRDSLQTTYAAVWDEVVAPAFDAGGRPLFPLPHRLASGFTVVIDGARVTSRNDGTSVHVHLYVVDAGDWVFPFVGVESFGFWGMRSKEAERVAALFGSLRIAGYRPDADAPLFTDRDALVGTWGLSHSSSIEWAGGQLAGTSVTFASNSFTLAADGSYSQLMHVMIADSMGQPGRITGNWTLDNGWLVMTPVTAFGDINATATRQRVLTVALAPSGRTVLVLEGEVSFVDLDSITLPIYERKEGP